ncbi:RodZ domain-containing protein [Moritella viscosa]|uniref:HTH cro/C1-type domain-containing protein n=1 Tax=Moritella viscosa TaxID=80854 RepID=A0A090IDG9_9GAMM|nr:RodZ domain-containing protein [Moritella viscosa]CED58697.1 membrane protein [Moritella viscosa]SGY83220.1 Putative uncharacterized protein [Moritella viscosa]SGY84290.1 Putative uncharacterized protein [Moritella viscosa]SGY84483.1 Putative uncharacterized protein [Moritella viscosa]SHN97476.1 Putative uncharacterized protein [Moritella viscosa]
MTIDLETLKNADKPAELKENIDVITAGQILRDARIALGISVQQVSDNINLKLSVINNIEKNVLDKDISPTFMRGYIRCYSRYLNITEDDVLRAYDCHNGTCGQQAELQSFSRRTKLEAYDNRLMLVSYGIVGFMLVIFLIWGLGGDEADIVVPDSVATQTIESVASPEVIGAVTVIEEEAPLFVDPEQEITESTVDSVEKPALPIVVEQPAETLSVATNILDNKVIVPQSLVLTFAGDCWVQIKDSNGKTLSTGVRKAGQKIQLQGLAPLSIKLGAPEQVTMSYAGESVDLSTFRQGQLAKFKLPFEA